jgi:hypothetical protein
MEQWNNYKDTEDLKRNTLLYLLSPSSYSSSRYLLVIHCHDCVKSYSDLIIRRHASYIYIHFDNGDRLKTKL